MSNMSVNPQTGGVLTSLSEYDSIRENAENVTRLQNLDIVTTASGDTLGICHLAVFMPFSRVMPDQRRIPFPHGYQASFATALAAHHLNTGNGTIVPEVEGLSERCDIRFTVELIDSEFFQAPAVKNVLNVLSRVPGKDRLPTAFLGNTRSPVAMATSVITGLAGYPQLGIYPVTNELNDKSQHPLFGRLIPDSDGHALPIVKFFSEVLGAKHLAVVHNNDGYGDAYARAILKTAQEYTPDLQVEFIDLPVKSTPDDYVNAVTFLKSTQFRYFFAPILDANFESLMEEAFRQNIAGTGMHNWMFSASIQRAVRTKYEKDSPLHLATRGISMIDVIGGKAGTSTRDRYEPSWDSLNNDQDINYIKSKLPQYDNYDSSLFIGDGAGFFPGFKGQVADTLSYDAAILLGLAACAAAEEKRSEGNAGGPPNVDGQTHYQKVLDINFQGVSGEIVLEPSTGSRDPVSAYFDLLNFNTEDDATNSSLVNMNKKQAYIFENGNWDEVAPWVFNDGTSTIPSDLPEVSVNMNYIGSTLRGVGLAIACITITLSIGFSAWSLYFGKARVVRASQPIFLHIICVGIFIMGATIIPLSFDDEIASNEACSIACMLIPWFLCIGFATTFSAFLAKTWRTNKIFHNPSMKRVVVTPLDVMKPLFISLTANVIVLAVWSSLSPLKWQREVVAVDIFDRVVESHGSCRSDSSLLYFVVSLTFINIGVLLLAVHQAYVARNISMEFAESEYIARALYTTMLVSFVAIPVMVIVTDEPRAIFFALTSVIAVLCASVLLFIFVPKIMFVEQGNGRERIGQAIRSYQSANFSTNNSNRFNNSSAEITFSEPSEEGVTILYHPNMRQDLQDEVSKLKLRIQELESKNQVKNRPEVVTTSDNLPTVSADVPKDEENDKSV